MYHPFLNKMLNIKRCHCETMLELSINCIIKIVNPIEQDILYFRYTTNISTSLEHEIIINAHLFLKHQFFIKTIWYVGHIFIQICMWEKTRMSSVLLVDEVWDFLRKISQE